MIFGLNFVELSHQVYSASTRVTTSMSVVEVSLISYSCFCFQPLFRKVKRCFFSSTNVACMCFEQSHKMFKESCFQRLLKKRNGCGLLKGIVSLFPFGPCVDYYSGMFFFFCLLCLKPSHCTFLCYLASLLPFSQRTF